MGRIVKRPFPELPVVPKNHIKSLRFATNGFLRRWRWPAVRSAGSKGSAISARERTPKLLMNVVDGGPKQELTLDVLRRHGGCRLQVSGTSMLPALWPGDRVSIERRSLQEVTVGDIVLYERCGRLFLHRLVSLPEEKFPNRVIMRGDSMPHPDPAVRPESLLGVLVGVRREDGWVPVPGNRSRLDRVAGALLARSSLFVQILVRIRFRQKSGTGSILKQHRLRDTVGRPSDSSPEVPAS
jgi:signal peptidase I